jgi:hypothetical protein
MLTVSSINRVGEYCLRRASKRAVLGVALGAGVFTFCAIGAIDWLMNDAGFNPFGIMLGSTALVSLLVILLIYTTARNASARREALHRNLKMLGETNHHVRNALELIQLSTHTIQDQEVIAQISVGVERIQWVLRELVGENTSSRERTSDLLAKRNNEEEGSKRGAR